MLKKETVDAILELQKGYPEKRSALIPALHLAQEEAGYLPIDTQNQVAELFDLPATEIYAIVSFYDMFFDKPTGKHRILVCKNASCMLRGCDRLLETLCNKLDIKPGETTKDGRCTVIASECLAACDKAPMMIVDGTCLGPVKEEEIDTILEGLHG